MMHRAEPKFSVKATTSIECESIRGFSDHSRTPLIFCNFRRGDALNTDQIRTNKKPDNRSGFTHGAIENLTPTPFTLPASGFGACHQ
jgi:hypothetical protein